MKPLLLKKDEARLILASLKMPNAQQGDICCYSLLAMANITESADWASASSRWIRIHDIIRFTENSYGVHYAENSRETFRKQAMHHFRNAAIIEDNGRATNSPNYSYRLTEESLALLRSFGSDTWEAVHTQFMDRHTSLIDLYTSKKKMSKIPIQVNHKEILFTVGRHNELQKLILEEFAPRFAPHSECLYIGDTAKKNLSKNAYGLLRLGISISPHDKLPDIILYRADKDWLYFIEAVASVGPIDSKRMIEICAMTEHANSGKIFVSAFFDFKTFKSFIDSLAWETEVWISEMPDHIIHLDGDRFLNPR